ncbi:MAG: glycerol-3-phosphate dehydrogenase, partial [Xanthomonadales bacterium]|nr:glycerol-3-phosphate dehydrogenase [Xanthomonadales bacterium]
MTSETGPLAVAVVGAGSWGTALASLLARNGVPTRLWARDGAMLAAMAASHRNQRYLPECELPASLVYEADLDAALHDVAWVLLAVPSDAFAGQLPAVCSRLSASAGLAWATKGFEPGTGRFLHELVDELRPGAPAAVVTGPSFAR